jgi:hypothetical protein
MDDEQMALLGARAEELARVLRGTYTIAKRVYDMRMQDAAVDYISDVPALLAEVERLQAENAALREIVEVVANAKGGGTSGLYFAVPDDGSFANGFDEDYALHVYDKARALLGKSN